MMPSVLPAISQPGQAGAGVVIAPCQLGHHAGEMLGKADQEREDVFGHALRVRPGRVDDLDAALGGGLDVDLVVAHAVPADHLQVGPLVQQRGVDDSAGPDDQGLGPQRRRAGASPGRCRWPSGRSPASRSRRMPDSCISCTSKIEWRLGLGMRHSPVERSGRASTPDRDTRAHARVVGEMESNLL